MQCRVAGYGPHWQQAHTLGRDAPVPEGMSGYVIAGLSHLARGLRATHPDHPMLALLDTLEWLVTVFIQDMPLKLALYGHSWARLFPSEVTALTSHPGCPEGQAWGGRGA